MVTESPRYSKSLPSKFLPLLDFKECKKWVEDLSTFHRNWNAVREYTASFAQFVDWCGKTVPELARLKHEKAMELMQKFVVWRVREVGVSPKKAHNQWFSLASFFRTHGIKEDFKFPSRTIPVTVRYLDKIPTKEELRRILHAPRLDLSTKIAIHLIAYSGLRPDDICSLTYGSIREDFEKGTRPCTAWIPQGKTGRAYVTFISPETIELLEQYLNQRKSAGEKITESSPIIIDQIEFKQTSTVKTVLRKSLSIRITRAMRKSGVRLEERFREMHRKMRPYSLRKYFRSNLTSHMPNEYIEAMLGHTTGLEHIYGGTRDLDPTTIERMREMYKKSEPFLLASSQPLDQNAVVQEAKIEALKTIAKSILGIDLMEVKIAKEKELGKGLTVDEQMELFENEIKKIREKADPQKIVKENELEEHLADGWEFVSVLPSERILIRK